MKLSEYNLLYINLKSRQDRNIQMESQVKRLGLNYIRIEAVDGLALKNKDYFDQVHKELELNVDIEFYKSRKNFKTMRHLNYFDTTLKEVGCFLSHLKILKCCRDKGLKNIIIMEDDILIESNFEIELPKEFDILYLSTCNTHFNQIGLTSIQSKIYGTGCYHIANDKLEEVYQVLMSPFKNSGPTKSKLTKVNWRSGDIRLRVAPIDLFLINTYQTYGNCFINKKINVDTTFTSDIQSNPSKVVGIPSI